MIKDNIKNAALYHSNDSFKKAFEFLGREDLATLECTKYEIDGANVYAMVQCNQTKAAGSFESHEKYIDIQYIIEGREVMECADISTLTVKRPYRPEADCTLYEDNEGASRLVLGDGDFAVFYPHDGHKPGLAYGDPATVKKVVVKVKV